MQSFSSAEMGHFTLFLAFLEMSSSTKLKTNWNSSVESLKYSLNLVSFPKSLLCTVILKEPSVSRHKNNLSTGLFFDTLRFAITSSSSSSISSNNIATIFLLFVFIFINMYLFILQYTQHAPCCVDKRKNYHCIITFRANHHWPKSLSSAVDGLSALRDGMLEETRP